MGYREYLPHPALRPFVDRLWSSSSAPRLGARAPQADGGSAPTNALRRVLPDGCIDLIVDLERAELRAVGAMSTALVLRPAPDERIAAVRFRPGGATPFLRIAAGALSDRAATPEELGLEWLARARGWHALDLVHAVEHLQTLLLSRLAVTAPPHPAVVHAARALLAPAPPRIAALERELGWSRQHLARLFQGHVGLRPKQFARVARMQRAVVLLQRRDGPALAEIALRLGYADQAHMHRDLRQLVGLSPAAVRAAPGSISPITSLLR
ncbi:helix-turn-helix transcriptional regulator [Haliangium ochraceum]|uniref:Transcriptional regulator, AraC family n=1 Tax=Haliangium ochraceum (strain DSM 14365 / JCM 11303 / SMP-2) TaxID=502025 RepID=D0LMA7_HALO1|nr:helix-turn-helix transcriptional regulator [Haliangium ochraceum]ACY16813.1 transcriptional regulator, AraC family [Haliangium ochraceum DSM 14365]